MAFAAVRHSHLSDGTQNGLDETISARIAVCDRGRVERAPACCRPIPLAVGTHRRIRFSLRHPVGVASRPRLVNHAAFQRILRKFKYGFGFGAHHICCNKQAKSF
jgi:hypothetical protein